MFQEELGPLKAFGKFLANRLLDHAGSGEADEGPRLGDVQVSNHRETGRYPSRSGVCHQRNVGYFRIVEAGEGGGDFGKLHEGGDAFHHAGTAGGGDDDQGVAGAKCSIYSSCDGFANDRAHGAADKTVLHGADDDRLTIQGADRVDDSVVEAGLPLGFFEASLVRLKINKMKGIGGLQTEVDELVSFVEEVADPGAGVDAEVVIALGANVLILKEIGLEDGLPAALAADPKTLGSDCFLFVGDDLMIFAFKPGHRGACLVQVYPGHCTVSLRCAGVSRRSGFRWSRDAGQRR